MSTPQENFWKNKITESYVQENASFSERLGLVAWERILSKSEKSAISSYLDCNLIDYGFLWGYEFDIAGFDDITWWLFEKSQIN